MNPGLRLLTLIVKRGRCSLFLKETSLIQLNAAIFLLYCKDDIVIMATLITAIFCMQTFNATKKHIHSLFLAYLSKQIVK